MARKLYVIDVRCGIKEVLVNKFKFGKEYFVPYADDPLRMKSYGEQLAWLEKFVPLKGSRVLDYGCGIGLMMSQIESWGGNVFGCDISEYAVNECKKRGLKAELVENIEWTESDHYDLIILRGVFQHLWAPNKTISECFTQLRPGGVIAVLSTPNIESTYYRKFAELPTLSKQLALNLPSKSTIFHCLELNGFEVISHRYPYLESFYASPIVDSLKFILRLVGFSIRSHAFPGNVIDVVARKC